MIKQGLVLKLKPGALSEYIRHHDQIPTHWPELAAALRASGIKTIRTFAAEAHLFLYAEVEDEGAFPRLWDTEAHIKWAEIMDPLIELDVEKKPDARFIPQIFNFEA
jgi:L-rhamnose mutarotase